MKQFFNADLTADDVISWVRKLACLGGTIETLAELGDKECLNWYGQGLGSIVVDYADAIQKTLNELYPEISDFLEKYESLQVAEIDREYSRIKGMPDSPCKKERINENLEKIREFKDSISLVFDIEEKLKNGLNGRACQPTEKNNI